MPRKRAISIVVIDNHSVVRYGIHYLLDRQDEFLASVVGEAGDGDNGLKVIAQTRPDIVLLNISMPGLDSLEVITRAREILPSVKIIMITVFSDATTAKQFLKAGAAGYVLKEEHADNFNKAIQHVFAGKHFISDKVAQNIALESFKKSPKSNPFMILSQREYQIMTMIAKGLTVKQVSEQLEIAQKTINTYRYRLFRKLNIKTNVSMTRLAIKFGVVKIENPF